MWYDNKAVIRTHSKNGSRMAWAFIEGISGYKRIRPTSNDGVTNVFLILSTARANNRRVDVYIRDGYIEQATLR
ncbi:MAG: hypothetical protein GY941_01650 [Planctomycetes bacterium]|nr:hypothetical protein [Planctomycetota bacterium]